MNTIFGKTTTQNVILKGLCVIKKSCHTNNHTPPHPHTSDSVCSGFGSNESKGDLIFSGDGGRGNVVKDFG